MFRTAFLFSAFAAFAIGAEDKDKAKKPYFEVSVEKVKFEPGKFDSPVEVSTYEELEKAVPDEAAREAIVKSVDCKAYKLVIFSWQGSGQDKIEVLVKESFPEQLVFQRVPGRTKDLRTHLKVYAVRRDVKYTAK